MTPQDPLIGDDLQALPSIDALVAGTVALMSAWALPCPHARQPVDELRPLIARKVVSNLFWLAHHPLARPELRQSLANAHACWQQLARGGAHRAAGWALQGDLGHGRLADARGDRNAESDDPRATDGGDQAPAARVWH